MDIPAPGDIRNVIAALSDSESTLTQLFQYRFDENKSRRPLTREFGYCRDDKYN